MLQFKIFNYEKRITDAKLLLNIATINSPYKKKTHTYGADICDLKSTPIQKHC